MPPSEAQKKASKKYRESNKERYNDYMREVSRVYYESHRDEVLERKKKIYAYKKEAKTLRNILLEN